MKTFVPRPLLLALTLVLIVCAIAYVELRFDRASAGNAQVVPDPPPAAQREETTEPSAAEQAPPERAGRESAEERVARKEAEFTRAAEIVGPSGFINTDGITIGENMGEKVVLIEF